MKTFSLPLLACVLAGTACLGGQANAQVQRPGAQIVSQAAQRLLDAADWKSMTDERVDLIKAALQLSPEQAKYWPAIEDAIRARAQMRYDRLQALATPRSERRDMVMLMRDRAMVLSERSAALKKLAEAWEPLWPSLSIAQKARLRILAALTIHEMASRIDDARTQMLDGDDDEATD